MIQKSKALREKLREHNGIRGLEICDPHEVQRAARIFHRDGFVVVRDLLNPDQLARWRDGCAEALRDILSIPGSGNRKYTLLKQGGCHTVIVTALLPLQGRCCITLLGQAWLIYRQQRQLSQKFLESSDYRVWGSGGDLCLPGAIEYQHLHLDGRDPQHLSEARVAEAERLDLQLHRDDNGKLDVPSQKLIMEMTPPMVTINFIMCDLTWGKRTDSSDSGDTHVTTEPAASGG